MTFQDKMAKLIEQEHLCQCPACQLTEAKMFHDYSWAGHRPALTTDAELIALHLPEDAEFVGVAV